MTTTAKSVLSKIGQVILTAGGVATEVMGFPFLSTLLKGSATGSLIATGVGDLSSVASIVSQVEVGFAAIAPTDQTGSAKLKAATPMVQQVILSWAASNLPGHNKLIVDPTKFSADVAAFTSSFVNILNDFGD
jgi:hypothetical protein